MSMNCLFCNRPGHSESGCWKKHVCPKCGKKDHPLSKCQKTDNSCPCNKPSCVFNKHKCTYCNKVGIYHLPIVCQKFCPNCGMFGQRGHDLKDCRKKDDRCPCPARDYHKYNQHICGLCNETGNYHSTLCPEKCPCQSRDRSKFHSLQNHHCSICNKKGFNHFKDDCPERCPCGSSNHRIHNHPCRICNKSTDFHSAISCPEQCPCGEQVHSKLKHICDYCNEIGFNHYKEDCPKKCPCLENKYKRTISSFLILTREFVSESVFDKDYLPLDLFKIFLNQITKSHYDMVNDHKKILHCCKFCGKQDYQHEDEKCPDRCPCGEAHTITEHYCQFCEEQGYDHLEEECKNKCTCKCKKCKSHHAAKCCVCKIELSKFRKEDIRTCSCCHKKVCLKCSGRPHAVYCNTCRFGNFQK